MKQIFEPAAKSDSTIAIIGGADGPTSIIVSDPSGMLPIIAGVAAALAALLIAGIVFYVVNKRKKHK